MANDSRAPYHPDRTFSAAGAVLVRVMMKKTFLMVVLVLSALLTSCRLVNDHTFKVTSTPEIQATEARIATTKGYLYLSAASLDESKIDMLKSIRPFQCLNVRTAEPFDMNNRSVRFQEFKLKKLVEGDRECRKIKTTFRISGQ